MRETGNIINWTNNVLYKGPQYSSTVNGGPRMGFQRTSTPVSAREDPGEELYTKRKELPLVNEGYDSMDFPRTSTPLPVMKHPGKATKYSIDIGYEKWSEKLKNRPKKLQVKGVADTPRGIVSGHLVPMENDKLDFEELKALLEDLPPATKIIPIDVVTNTKKGFRIPKKFKSLFKIPCKSLLQCHFVKSKNKDTCISGYPKCTCKLNESVMGNYKIIPPLY